MILLRIEINLSLRQLKLMDLYQIKGIYPIAIGKASTPTPTGHYQIIRKVINPGGILGSRWLELSIPSTDGPYGIHGTTMPWSIGKAASNGCIRMYNEHVEEVFNQVSIGTAVAIAY
ncbi:MAG: L,D-transpeptidase [Bacillota bacterium]